VRIACNRRALHDALQHVGRVVSGRTTLPILSNVLLEGGGQRMRVVAYDMELGAESWVEVEVQEEGAVTVPARLLSDIVAGLPEATVEMGSRDRSILELKCGSSEYSINGLPAEEYPVLPEVEGEVSFEIEQGALKEMIQNTIFAVSRDETRAILTGVLLAWDGKRVKMVTTDSYRLALRTAPEEGVREVSAGEKWAAIIPARALQELNRMLEPEAEAGPVKVQASTQRIMFEAGPYRLLSRLIEGQFPNYERIIPTEAERTITVNREALLGAIKRAALVARAEASKLVFVAEGEGLTIQAESGDVGKAREELGAKIEGEGMTIAFNAEYLMDALGVMDSEEVVWHLGGPLTTALLKGAEDPDYLYMVAPMQA